MCMVFIVFVFTLILYMFQLYGMKYLREEKPRNAYTPTVSIIIPSYKSRIEKTLKSALKIDYPKKEIIVINDFPDNTKAICENLGVKCIQKRKRLGKPNALNLGIKHSKGEILLLLDSDTLVPRNILKEIIPWFTNKKVSAVMPGYKSDIFRGLKKMIDIENTLMLSFVRAMMFFKTSIGYRGCCVALRRETVKKLGGIPQTILEDNDFAAKIVKSGHAIIYEPSVYVKTQEPKNLKELKKQKFRWGKGAFFTFLHHYSFYAKSPQFLLCFLPYALIIAGLLLNNFSEAVYAPFLIPFHIYIITRNERKLMLKDIVKFTFLYLPVVLCFYLRGVVSGIKAKLKAEPELDLNCW